MEKHIPHELSQIRLSSVRTQNIEEAGTVYMNHAWLIVQKVNSLGGNRRARPGKQGLPKECGKIEDNGHEGAPLPRDRTGEKIGRIQHRSSLMVVPAALRGASQKARCFALEWSSLPNFAASQGWNTGRLRTETHFVSQGHTREPGGTIAPPQAPPSLRGRLNLAKCDGALGRNLFFSPSENFPTEFGEKN